jgi:hypothetical protein
MIPAVILFCSTVVIRSDLFDLEHTILLQSYDTSILPFPCRCQLSLLFFLAAFSEDCVFAFVVLTQVVAVAYSFDDATIAPGKHRGMSPFGH